MVCKLTHWDLQHWIVEHQEQTNLQNRLVHHLIGSRLRCALPKCMSIIIAQMCFQWTNYFEQPFSCWKWHFHGSNVQYYMSPEHAYCDKKSHLKEKGLFCVFTGYWRQNIPATEMSIQYHLLHVILLSRLFWSSNMVLLLENVVEWNRVFIILQIILFTNNQEIKKLSSYTINCFQRLYNWNWSMKIQHTICSNSHGNNKMQSFLLNY